MRGFFPFDSAQGQNDSMRRKAKKKTVSLQTKLSWQRLRIEYFHFL